MKQFTKVFNYQIVSEKPIDQLIEFKDHRRLRVFCSRGTICVTCGKIGTRLIEGLGRGGKHWDIYTDDLYPLTVDHIIPKSLGGSDELENLQPMCAGCNFRKGNGMQYNPGSRPWIPKGYRKCSMLNDYDILIGKKIYIRKKYKNVRKKQVKELGIVGKVFMHELLLYHYVTIEGEDENKSYNIKNLFIPEQELLSS